MSYGRGDRQKIDVYVPRASAPQLSAPSGAEAGPPAWPVFLFVHGGVWASGERWNYAPLGRELAQRGVMAMVGSYSLFPEVQVGTQVGEVGQMLDWALQNAAAFGGDARNLSLVGHSAGAQLCAMEVLQEVKVPKLCSRVLCAAQ